MDKGRKAWRNLESLKGLHDERERREKGERFTFIPKSPEKPSFG